MSKYCTQLGVLPTGHAIRLSRDSDAVVRLLESCQSHYPDILSWYYHSFSPGLQADKRFILFYFVDDNVAAFALLKKEFDEKKICTFKVQEKYLKNGIGKTLLSKCLDILETEKPLITIPQEKLTDFENIIGYFNFELCQIIEDCYKKHSREYVFNGYLNHSLDNSVTMQIKTYVNDKQTCARQENPPPSP